MRKLQDFQLGVQAGEPKRLGILIHGDAGTGKTALVAGLANHLHCDIYDHDLSDHDDPSVIFSSVKTVMFYQVRHLEYFEDRGTTQSACTTDPYCESLLVTDDRAREHVRSSFKQTGADLGSFLLKWEMFQQSGNTVTVAEVNDLTCVHPALLQPGFFDTVIHMRKASHAMLRDIIGNVYDEAVTLEDIQSIPERVWAPSDVIEASLRHPDAESLIQYLEGCHHRSDIFRCRQ